ncbi:MAG: hypothetical protein WEA99_00580 [Brumimicrobium sp.]
MKRILKEFESIDLDFSTFLFLIFDLVVASSEVRPTDINHSKSYFARYYGIDLETFHKWIRIFCPDLWNEEYKRKRKFSKEEANYILEKLGHLSFDKIPPQDHKALMNEIYKGTQWKKSRRYQEIALELEDRFPNESIKINKIPPKIIFEILEEEKEGYNSEVSVSEAEHYGSQIQALYTVLLKYNEMTSHQKAVLKRYLRINIATHEKKNK